MKLYEQVDKIEGRLIYRWLLDGISGSPANKRAMETIGWEWVRGRPGGYETRDEESAREAMTRLRIGSIESNGTHAAHNADGKLCKVRKMVFETTTARTGQEAAEQYARTWDLPREIESWTGNRFSWVCGVSAYEVCMTSAGFQIWRL